MAEELKISSENKDIKYKELLPQIISLTADEPNLIANLANIAAALRQTFNWFWVGFYSVEGKELVLGPFQGEIACTRIGYNKGVCGKAWADKASLIIENVDDFPGHIACSAQSKSEIVVPILKNDKVRLVIDIDSVQVSNFDSIDRTNLEILASYIESLI